MATAPLTRRRKPASADAGARAPLPGDVRLMNAVSTTVFVLATLLLVVAAAARGMRTPAFDIRSIQVEGDLARNSVPTIRANALPSLRGNFFSIDLHEARAAFEQVPWVRQAVVRRVWPDRLAVRLEEHRAAALWEGEGLEPDAEAGGEKLVNSFGEVFDANLGDVEDESLPVFSGPSGSAAQMLALWRRLAPAFAQHGLAIERLSLSGRGSWRVLTENAAVVELGRGSTDEVVARSERFLRTLVAAKARVLPAAGAASPATNALLYADLRHMDGYALRLRGVSTAAAQSTGTAKPAPTN
jgi:cell division protein FtsQ